MRIHIGADHAGLELKSALIEHLSAQGHEVKDHGPYEYDALDDYPDFCIPAAEAVGAMNLPSAFCNLAIPTSAVIASDKSK